MPKVFTNEAIRFLLTTIVFTNFRTLCSVLIPIKFGFFPGRPPNSRRGTNLLEVVGKNIFDSCERNPLIK